MTFFLDLWHDLRERRLWPVAVALLAATLAVPLVMLKPAGNGDGSSQTPVFAQANKPAELPAVTVASGAASGSKLQTFSGHNPFTPLHNLDKAASTSSTTTSSSSGSTASAGSSGNAKSVAHAASGGSGGGSGSGGPSAGGGSPPPSGGGSSAPSSGGGSTPHTQYFRYTADVQFGTPDKMKTHHGLTALSMLPSSTKPEVVFMGVTAGGKDAVFFVSDDTLKADGEGKCNDTKNCRYVTLSTGEDNNEETFTSADGTRSYDLKLLKIRQAKLSSSQASGKTSAAPKGKGKAVTKAAKAPKMPQLTFIDGLAASIK